MAIDRRTPQLSRPEHLLMLKRVALLCAKATSIDALLEAFGKLVLESLSDLVAVDLVEDDGSIKRYLTLHASETIGARLADQREMSPLGMTASYGYPRVIKTGKSQFIPGVTGHLADRLLSAAKPGEASRVTVRSFICAPLIAHGRTLGAVTVANTDRATFFTADDLLLLEEMSLLLADALDRLQ